MFFGQNNLFTGLAACLPDTRLRSIAKVNSWTGHYNRPISLQEQQLYNHLLHLSQVESPGQLIERFRLLFVEGTEYPEPKIQAALEQIVSAKTAAIEFRFILNRCCYILINRWLMHPRLQLTIPSLVDIFELRPSAPAYSRSTQRLRELVQLFTQTDQYVTLRRLAEMMQQDLETGEQSQPLGNYIRRYPYLYEHCLLAEDSGDEQRRTIRRIRAQAQRQFEVDLSQYVVHRIVRSQPCSDSSPSIIYTPGSDSHYESHGEVRELASKIDLSPYVTARMNRGIPTQSIASQPIKNPTLLSDEALCTAVKQFVFKVDGQHTQRDLAQHFLTYSRQTQTYRVFKEDLYDYLTAAVSPEYGKRQFYNRLYTQLQETLPENDTQQPTEFLLVRTCSRLLNFLVVESPQQPNHFVFLDLISNIGTTFAVNLLLKIVLLCQKVKPHLERRFSILFNHYESYTRESGIGWLIEALETLNVAFATNFGSTNFY